MTLLALLLGLLIERLITNLLHLRELRWFDSYFDWGIKYLTEMSGIRATFFSLVLALLPVAPVALISFFAGDRMLGVPYVVFAVFVLLLSLGPRDLAEEVDEYCIAVERDDAEAVRRVTKELTETSHGAGDAPDKAALQEAIFVQANNRIFGVILWFLLLGPAGAWLFRVTDLMRRRVVFESERRQNGRSESATALSYVRTVQSIHGLLAWLPARLLALGYALAGSFEDAVSNWRGYYENCSEHFFEVNDDVVACAGRGAMQTPAGDIVEEVNPDVLAVRSAMRLVLRTLFVWVTIISVLTLYGLAF